MPGDLYVALPGARAHGADYVADAVTAGAIAVLTDEAGAVRAQQQAPDVPLLVVPEPRRLLGGARRPTSTATRPPRWR